MKNKSEPTQSETVNMEPPAEGVEDDDAPQSKRRKLEEDNETETKKTEEAELAAEATQEELTGDVAVKNQESNENNEIKMTVEKTKKCKRNKDINKGELDEEAQILSLQVMSKYVSANFRLIKEIKVSLTFW